MKTSVLFSSIISVLILLSSGCISSSPNRTSPVIYSAEVDSIALPDADLGNKTYLISSAMKNVSDEDIQFKEFAKYIENALSLTGYKRVNSKDANLIIRFAYGIGKPKTEINAKSHTTSAGYSYQVGWTWIHVPPKTQTITTKNTAYDRFLILETYDSKNKQAQLWKTTVTSTGTDSDLRVVLPHMIASAIYKFGTDTKGRQRTGIYQNAPPVLGIIKMSQNLLTGKERLGARTEPLAIEKKQWYHSDYAGVLVVEVGENSVAQEMGLQRYDIILGVNNKIVGNPSILIEEVRSTKEDGEIRIDYFSWETRRVESRTARLE